ncbi:hypothetical protein E0H75_17085 [Kribbella capetownensis]|uniref:Uncharacterized protein n=1 Tax=Kribbella capetownensis TaxID=1572659 RepID=A0A4R0JSV3_9ACTN|nr:hypothetical protein [Kribbella capetownensis]TCC50009.1 hypothetical protein E0H75_17085 [Kribbella capetownensis]
MPTVSPAQRSLTLVTGAMLAAIPVITLVVWVTLAADGVGEFPPTWAPLVVLVAAALAYAFCELAGFRAPALEYSARPAAEIEAESWRRFTQSTFTRFAVCEGVFMLSIALAFVVDSFWVVLVGAVLALPLVAWEVWPGPRDQQRFAASLEARGTPSYLTGRLQD